MASPPPPPQSSDARCSFPLLRLPSIFRSAAESASRGHSSMAPSSSAPPGWPSFSSPSSPSFGWGSFAFAALATGALITGIAANESRAFRRANDNDAEVRFQERPWRSLPHPSLESLYDDGFFSPRRQATNDLIATNWLLYLSQRALAGLVGSHAAPPSGLWRVLACACVISTDGHIVERQLGALRTRVVYFVSAAASVLAASSLVGGGRGLELRDNDGGRSGSAGSSLVVILASGAHAGLIGARAVLAWRRRRRARGGEVFAMSLCDNLLLSRALASVAASWPLLSLSSSSSSSSSSSPIPFGALISAGNTAGIIAGAVATLWMIRNEE